MRLSPSSRAILKPHIRLRNNFHNPIVRLSVFLDAAHRGGRHPGQLEELLCPLSPAPTSRPCLPVPGSPPTPAGSGAGGCCFCCHGLSGFLPSNSFQSCLLSSYRSPTMQVLRSSRLGTSILSAWRITSAC